MFAYRPSPEHCNPMGAVHGGIAMTLLDSAAGCAVHTTLEAGRAYATLETKVNLVRSVRADGPELRAEGSVVHRGRTVATSEARLVDAEGEMVRARDLDLPDPRRLTGTAERGGSAVRRRRVANRRRRRRDGPASRAA